MGAALVIAVVMMGFVTAVALWGPAPRAPRVQREVSRPPRAQREVSRPPRVQREVSRRPVTAIPPPPIDIPLPTIVSSRPFGGPEFGTLEPAHVEARLRKGVSIFGRGRYGVWDWPDVPECYACASVLFGLGQSADGPLRRTLMAGAAAFDSSAILISAARGGGRPNAEFFDRVRQEDAEYNARVQVTADSVISDSGSVNVGNLINPVTWGKVMALAGEAFYDGVSRVFEGSHGGGPSVKVTLAWSPTDADDWVHRAWRAVQDAA